MLTYRDMTFCPFYEGCEDGETCERALTEDVMKKAELVGLYIGQFGSKPECYKPKSSCE